MWSSYKYRSSTLIFFPLLLKLLLESDRATLMDHSKYTREQELKLTDEMSYKAAWYGQ